MRRVVKVGWEGLRLNERGLGWMRRGVQVGWEKRRKNDERG